MAKKQYGLFEIAGKTDKGRVKEKNEDNYGFYETPNGFVAVLCDGMGGHSAGAHASEIAVDSIHEYFESNTYTELDKAINDSFVYANNQIFDESKDNEDYFGMGTTCVLCLIKDKELFFNHVGDSRLYLLRDGHLKQLTKDHSVVQQLIDANEISVEDAKSHPRKNELYKALGVSDEIAMDEIPEKITAKNNDVILMCSDGLSNMLNDNTIEYVLSQNSSATDKVEKLLDLALKEGGYDNITLQIIQFANIEEGSIESEIPKKKASFNNLLFKIPFIKRNPKIIFAVYALIALLFAYAIYDLFFKQSQIPGYQSNENVIVVDDSTSVADENKQPDNKDKNEEQATDNSSNLSNNNDTSIVFLTYTIKKGDALSLLAQRFNIKSSRLMELNTLDKAGLRVGQQIKIPLQAIYTVKSGDNLYNIATKFGVTRKLLRKTNRLKNDNDIYVGSDLYIPFP